MNHNMITLVHNRKPFPQYQKYIYLLSAILKIWGRSHDWISPKGEFRNNWDKHHYSYLEEIHLQGEFRVFLSVCVWKRL